MYCSACGSPITAGLKFCNRCGASLNKDADEVKGGSIAGGLLTSVVMVALFGLGIMFSGAIALRKGGDMNMDVVALFMFFCFAIIGITEIFLLRQLTRVLAVPNRQELLDHAPPLFQPAQTSARELLASPLRDLELMPSVTEGTTRTLAHSLREIPR